MQRCHFCGSEFPDNARFCGTCGRVPTSGTALNTAVPSFVSSPEESVYTIATSPLQQVNQSTREDEEERRRGAILPLPIPFGTQSSQAGGQAPLVQGIPSFSSTPAVQGTPTGMAGSAPLSNIVGQAPSAPNIAPSAGQQTSFGSQPSSWSNQPTPHYAHPTDLQSQVSPEHKHPNKHHHQHHEHPHHVHLDAHKTGSAARSTGGVAKTILIITVGIVVVAVGAGALAFALRSHSANLAGITHATSSNSSNPNANATVCGVSSNLPCGGPSSPIASGQSTGNFNFSGAVSGPMVITSFPACGVTQGNTYVMQIVGTVGGTQYRFLIGILSYKGPGTYTSQLTVDLIPATNSSALGNDGRLPVSISITNGGKTGTVSSDLEGILTGLQLSKGHVSAKWTCG